jgi:hypothetical protein
LDTFTDALEPARQIKSLHEVGQAYEGAARCRVALGDTDTAITELRATVDIYRQLRTAEAEPAAAYLAGLPTGPPQA